MKKDSLDEELIEINNFDQLSISRRSSSEESSKNAHLHTRMKNIESFDSIKRNVDSINVQSSSNVQSILNDSHLHTCMKNAESKINLQRSSHLQTRVKNVEILENVVRTKIKRLRSSKSSLLNQIDELSETKNTFLEITDIFDRLNIVDRIENAKQKVKEKTKEKSSFSRSIETIDLDIANIIFEKR